MTDKMITNGRKLAYLVSQYPGHTITQIIHLLQMPAIDINAAIWAATDLGYINAPDEETGLVELLKAPPIDKLGDDVKNLADTIIYCFEKMAAKERDLEENYLSNWTTGYKSHDVLIAVKLLENDKRLAEYVIEDPQLDKKGRPELDKSGEPIINVYTFFTLYENSEQLWGRKEFKKDPIKGK